MTKKELQATLLLLAEVRGAIAALKWYGKDYDSPYHNDSWRRS